MITSPPNNRALIISDHPKCASHVRSILDKLKITIAAEYDCLNSISVIRRTLRETGNTVFIRKSFSRMAHDWGLPSLIILDYRINLGAESVHDVDQRKLLRTFFISLVVMLKKKELENSRITFILITDKDDCAEALGFQKNPVSILDILQSDNEEINGLIRGIRDNPDEFNRHFGIVALAIDTFRISFEQAVTASLQIAGSEKTPGPVTAAADQTTATAAITPAAAPPEAHIYVRLDEKTIYCDGKPVPDGDNPSLTPLIAGHFYVFGRWEYKNQAEVAKRLGDLISGGIGSKRFHPNDEIIVAISDECIIDATVIASLAMLFTKQLSAFKNKYIIASYENAVILEKGSGYILIKKYIRHAY